MFKLRNFDVLFGETVPNFFDREEIIEKLKTKYKDSDEMFTRNFVHYHNSGKCRSKGIQPRVKLDYVSYIDDKLKLHVFLTNYFCWKSGGKVWINIKPKVTANDTKFQCLPLDKIHKDLKDKIKGKIDSEHIEKTIKKLDKERQEKFPSHYSK